MAHSLIRFGSFVVLLGGLIFIHELGHFLMAKLFKVKVLRFSIGFGPRLLGFTVGETEYRIAIIPLGGYVKMAGEDPTEPLSPADQGRGFQEQAPWKRSLIALAGPAMNLIFPVLIYFCIFYFQTQGFSTRAGNVDPDSPAYAAGLRAGDRIVEIDGHAVKYFNELRDLIGPRYDQKVHLKVERPDGSVFESDATPRKVMERELLHEEPRGVLGVGARQPAPVIAVTDPDSPAFAAGLRSLDRLTSVAGQPVKVWLDVERALAQQHGPFEVRYLRAESLPAPGANLVQFVQHTVTLTPKAGAATPEAAVGIDNPNGVIAEVTPNSPAAEAGLKRGDKVVSANGQPLLAWSTLERLRAQVKTEPIDLEVLRDGKSMHLKVVQRNKTAEDELGQPIEMLFFGAQPDTTDEPGELIPLHYTALYSLGQAVRIVPSTISQVVTVFWGLVAGKVAFKTVGGPGMLYDIATKSAEAGWDSFLSAMAMISINLGVMNLIPIPVLDGFHVLAAGFEWIRRRPLSLRAREYANLVGLGMLLLLMVFVLKNDFIRYVLN
jgi:regulator of sigma E protease